MFKRNNGLLHKAYTDTDHIGSLIDIKFTIEYCTFLGNLIWRNKEQNMVVQSSAKSKFRVMTQGVYEFL